MRSDAMRRSCVRERIKEGIGETGVEESEPHHAIHLSILHLSLLTYLMVGKERKESKRERETPKGGIACYK